MAYRPAGLRKRGRSYADGSETSRSPTRRRLTSKPMESPGSSESSGLAKCVRSPQSPLRYPIPDDNTLSDGRTPLTPTSPVSDDRGPVSDEQVCEFHQRGNAYQAWIADPTLGGCRCGISRKTLFELFNTGNKREKFTCPENHFDDPPLYIQEDLVQLGLPKRHRKYRFTRLLHHGYDEDGHKRESQYQHSIAEGVLIAECIYRYAGPHWSTVAIAQYRFDHPIDTLKYLYFTNVQNDETLPYVQEILYPRHDVEWPQFDRIESQTWEYDTEEYKEILGTKLGKAAVCLVIGAWERGTHRIAKIHTLGRQYQIHLRFDIEALPTALTDW
ncbi:unnamed protein product [Penicillium egyptiacum]|uniref:Uncharacterized protein n=1 Tax=Penicillium egyptiacum TaxID=1303716 RepID=A0A9W4K7W7_9EURO|nr:unnamed protein product [Penicillium egyptiacum]